MKIHRFYSHSKTEQAFRTAPRKNKEKQLKNKAAMITKLKQMLNLDIEIKIMYLKLKKKKVLYPFIFKYMNMGTFPCMGHIRTNG